jgi:hypothetical protein
MTCCKPKPPCTEVFLIERLGRVMLLAEWTRGVGSVRALPAKRKNVRADVFLIECLDDKIIVGIEIRSKENCDQNATSCENRPCNG